MLSHLTRKERDGVKGSREISRKQSRDAFCDPIALMRWSWMFIILQNGEPWIHMYE